MMIVGTLPACGHRFGQAMFGLYYCEPVPCTRKRAEDARLVAVSMDDADAALLEKGGEPPRGDRQRKVSAREDDRLRSERPRLGGELAVAEQNHERPRVAGGEPLDHREHVPLYAAKKFSMRANG